jgi:hypothetical protein
MYRQILDGKFSAEPIEAFKIDPHAGSFEEIH